MHRRHVPDEGGAVVAAGNQSRTVRREGEGGDPPIVAPELADLLARRRVPKADGVVLAAHDDPLAVRRDSHARDPGALLVRVAALLAAVGVDQADHSIPAGRRHGLAVRRETHLDAVDASLRGVKLPALLARLGVPEAGREVGVAAGDELAVGRETQGRRLGLTILAPAEFFAGCELPHTWIIHPSPFQAAAIRRWSGDRAMGPGPPHPDARPRDLPVPKSHTSSAPSGPADTAVVPSSARASILIPCSGGVGNATTAPLAASKQRIEAPRPSITLFPSGEKTKASSLSQCHRPP